MTPKSYKDTTKQAQFVMNRVSNHLDSSPTKLIESLGSLVRGITSISHRATLAEAKVVELKNAMHVLSKRRRARKTRLRNGGSFTQQEAQDAQVEIDVAQQIKQEDDAIPRPRTRTERGARRCGNCGATGHNARTYNAEVEITEEENSS